MNIVLSATLESIRSLKDKSIKLAIETQELEPEQASRLFGLTGKFVKILISDSGIEKAQIEEVENVIIEEDEGKSPSQRMRSVLYILWQQDNGGYKVFNDFYRAKMEVWIEKVKQLLK